VVGNWLTRLVTLRDAGAKPGSVEDTRAILPYARVRSPAVRVTPRAALTFRSPEPWPTHGVVIAVATFLGPHATWTIADFDTGAITRLRTIARETAESRLATEVLSRDARVLRDAELNALVETANALWNPPPMRPAPPRATTTDTALDVLLFDGGDVLRLSGFTQAVDPLVALANGIMK
jgi:hypothetical protein